MVSTGDGAHDAVLGEEPPPFIPRSLDGDVRDAGRPAAGPAPTRTPAEAPLREPHAEWTDAQLAPPALDTPAPVSPVAPPGWSYAPPPAVSGWAIATLVAGISSFFLVAFFGIGGLAAGVIAVIFGHRELGRLHPADSAGRTMTIIGLVCGYMGAVAGLIVTLVVVAYLVITLFMLLFLGLSMTW